MDRFLAFLGVYALYSFVTKNEAVAAATPQNLYEKLLAAKQKDGLGSRSWWQFVYINEIYFLLSPFKSKVTSGTKDPFFFEVYQVCEKVILNGENNLTYQSTLSNWIIQTVPNATAETKNNVLAYESKLFKVSQKLWSGKVLQ